MIATRKNLILSGLFALPITLLTLAVTNEAKVQAQEAPAATAEQPAVIPFENSLLLDTNGDGILQVAAFGDSITRGMGDDHSPGDDVESASLEIPTGEAGYPLRIERILGVGVTNLGDPGEDLTIRGISRFASLVLSKHYDVIFFMEGSNDGFIAAPSSSVAHAYQTAINIAKMAGTNVIMLTMPPVCCGHDGLGRFIDSYRDQVHHVAVVNGLAIADVDHAFRNTCNVGNCYLLNLPEGLHPNHEGYDIMTEAVLAAAFKIDLFSPTGRTDLETTLLLPPGSVQTEPDPIATPADPAAT